MGFTQEVLTNGTGIGGNVIKTLGAVVLLGGAVKGSVTKVQQGEIGVRTRFGVPREKKGQIFLAKQGLRVSWPLSHSIHKISVQPRSDNLGKIPVERDEDGRDIQYGVESSIIWHVSRDDNDYPRRALFDVKEGDLDDVVTNLCVAGLRDVMTIIPKDKMRNSAEVSVRVQDKCRDDLIMFGVQLDRVNIHSVARTPSEMLSAAINQDVITNGARAAVLGSLPELHSVDTQIIS